LLLTLAAAASANEFENDVRFKCDNGLPNLTVGHEWLTDKNYNSFKKKNSMFVLGISDSSCNRCCYTEPLFDILKRQFDDKTYTGKKFSKIKIARVDAASRPALLQEEGIPVANVPAIYVFYEGKYFRYDAPMNTESKETAPLLHLMNRLLLPLLHLNTEEEIARFLDVDTEPIENTRFFKKEPLPLGPIFERFQYKTRVIVFINDAKEYEQEVRNVKAAAK